MAKLRLLLVEPKARGLGLGSRLVQECIAFVRRAGYQKLVLCTNRVLVEEQHIYAKARFKLVEQEEHHKGCLSWKINRGLLYSLKTYSILTLSALYLMVDMDKGLSYNKNTDRRYVE